MKPIKLRYDGAFDWIQPDGRQWTILSEYIGPDGANYCKSSRIGAASLAELGIISAVYSGAHEMQCKHPIVKVR